MAEYRKKGSRMFFKVEGGNTVRILNKEKLSVITVADSDFIRDEAFDCSTEITKDEFVDAFNLAQERIQTMKI